MTTTNTEIGAFINAQVEDTEPDTAADFLLSYDTSTSGVKKVKPDNILSEGGAGDILWSVIQASQLINEIKGWPPIVAPDADLDALNLWWDKVGTPTTAPSVVDVAGESITETWELCIKCVADAASEGLSQRWTYADEPRVKSGRKLSILLAIWSVSAVEVTAKLVNSDASETAASAVTAAAWTIVEIPNHTLAGTYCDLKVTAGNAGTFYVVPLGANIGVRGIPLPSRPLRFVNNPTLNVVNDVDPGGSPAGYIDVDVTTQTSNLAVIVKLGVNYSNSVVNAWVHFRRNGDVTTSGPGVGCQTANSFGRGEINVALDDSQIFEYKSSAAAVDTEHLYISVFGWWEWG